MTTFEFNDDGFEELEREFKRNLDTNWIPVVNALSTRMLGMPKDEVLQALKATNTPSLVVNDETLDEWATMISEGTNLVLQ